MSAELKMWLQLNYNYVRALTHAETS